MSLKLKVTFDYRPSSIQAGKGTPYQCIKVANSLEFNPGDWYTGEVVLAHCRSPKWEVIIVGNG